MQTISCDNTSIMNIIVVIKGIINLIQIIVPILLIASASYHIFQKMRNPEDDKNTKKIINPFIAAVIIFFIPVLLNATMSLVGDKTDFSSCWNEEEEAEVSINPDFNDNNEKEKKKITYDAKDYEPGNSSASEFCPTKVSRTRTSYNNMTLVAEEPFYINSYQKFEDGQTDRTQRELHFTTQVAVYDCKHIIAGQHKSYKRNGVLHKNEGGRVAWYDITTGEYVTSVIVGNEGTHMARLAYDGDRDIILVGVGGGPQMLQIDNKTKAIKADQPYVTMSGGSNYFIKYDSYNHQLVGLKVGNPTSSISYYKYDESINSYVKTGSVNIKNYGKRWDPQNFNVDGQVIYIANSWPANGGTNNGFAVVVYDMKTGELLENHPLASNVTGGHLEDVIVDISGNLWLICPQKFWKAKNYVAHAFSIGP